MTVTAERQAMQDSIRLDAWRSVFQKVDRILSEQRVTVSIVDDVPQGMAEVPAWSDGLDIFLSGPKVREMLAANDKLGAVLRLKGLNYHELCHVLYTPRMTDELVRRLQKKVQDTSNQTWWYAFNALEDQRIETWFTSTYGASRRYFEATILEWIIKNGSPESAVLIYGRKYLTPRIRVQTGRVFTKRYGKDLYDEFRTVIDEYLTLVLPENGIRAMKLINDYVDLLEKMQAMHGAPLPMLVIADNGGDTCPDHGQPGVARQGRVFVKPARDAAAKAGEAIEDAIDADAAEEAARDAESDGEGPGQGAGGKPGKSQQQGQSGAGQDDGDDDQQGGSSSGKEKSEPQEGDETGSNGSGIGGGHQDSHVAQKDDTSLADEMSDLQDAAHDGMDDVREDEYIQEDVDRMLDAVKAAVENGKMNAQGAAVGGATRPPKDGENMAVRRVHDILSRIRQEAEPETLRRQTHGRADARRIVSRKPHETDIFKTWDHGNEEEVGVEAVVIVDVSGSMGNVMQESAAAMWALKRAFDKLDIRTTVLIFDTEHTVMYQPAEKAAAGGVPVLRPGGGTDPTSAIKQVERILSKSQSPNKVLITVTDGGWDGDENTRLRTMKHLHQQGVVSMLLGLDGAKSSYGKHGHLEGHDIASISELPKVATKLVANMMKNSIYV